MFSMFESECQGGHNLLAEKQAYITLMGRSGWAVVNSFHACVTETQYRPEKVVIVNETQYSIDVKPVIDGLRIIQASYASTNLQAIEVPDWDARASGRAIRELVDSLRSQGYEIALDITGGRKALVSGALLSLREHPLEHVFYLAIDTTEGAAKPYYLIPKRIQRLFDIVTNEVRNENLQFGVETKETDLTMTKDCMMILLNQAFARGERIIVKSPLLGVDLVEIDPSTGSTLIRIDRETYEQSLSANRYEGMDHPTFSDFKRCLCYCGVLQFENAKELREMVSANFAKAYDPASGLRRPVLSLDTNAFSSGVLSALEMLENELGIRARDIPCVTAGEVIKEVRKAIHDKYREGAIRAARNHYESDAVRRLLDELIGQNMLKTRSAKMAKSELVRFMSRPVHIKTELAEMPANHEQGDPLIVDSLAKFAKDKGVRIMLLSSDKQMLDQCDLAEDVGVMILRIPPKVPKSIKTDEQGFIRLLFGLALLYGVVELGRVGYLFGEYRGKQSEVYSEEVKLRVINADRARILRERIEMCTQLKKLQIAR